MAYNPGSYKRDASVAAHGVTQQLLKDCGVLGGAERKMHSESSRGVDTWYEGLVTTDQAITR